MNSIERRTLNQLRQIRTGRVTWHALSFRITFEYGRLGEDDHIYLLSGEWAKLAEDLYVRHRSSFAQDGAVSLTAKGENLLVQLEAEDAEEECIHGLGLKSACVICNGTIASKAREEPERTFRSKFPGQCPACNLPITIGQMIVWRPGSPARHESCTED